RLPALRFLVSEFHPLALCSCKALRALRGVLALRSERAGHQQPRKRGDRDLAAGSGEPASEVPLAALPDREAEDLRAHCHPRSYPAGTALSRVRFAAATPSAIAATTAR